MKQEKISYFDGNKELEGFLVYNEKSSVPSPTVILCHAWRGRDPFVCKKAIEIADRGYTTFALDMYGKGILGKTKEENEKLMSPFIEDRVFLLKRLQAGLETVLKQPSVNKNSVAVMGFCFGGLCALDLARSGANLKGAISVHGLLNAPERLEKKKIKAKIFALHGYLDPLVPLEQVNAFEKEMAEANVDWQLHVYGKSLHAFTHPEANDSSFGTVYNPTDAVRAWKSIFDFLEEVFAKA